MPCIPTTTRPPKQQLRNTTKSVADSFLVHFPSSQPLISSLLSQLSKLIILVPLSFFVTTAHICTTMMNYDHENFFPPFVNLSTSPYCTNISSQYNSTHYNNNAQHGAWYNSTACTTLPLLGKSQRTHLSTSEGGGVYTDSFLVHKVYSFVSFWYKL
jgi:hypothetical protein